MTSVRATLVLLAALGALALAGCAGGDDRLTKSEYEVKVRDVYAGIQEAFARTNVPLAELGDRVHDAQDELRAAASELEGVEPPEDVIAEHTQIAEAMRRYADDLERLRNAAEQGDERTVEDFNARIAQNESVEQIAEAAERMKFKGYDLGPIAEE